MQPQSNGGLPGGYEFLQEQPKQKRGLTGGGSSKQKRIIIAAVSALVLIIIGFVFMNFLNNANKPKTELLLKVLQDQQEIIRISELGTQRSKSSDVKGYALIVKSTVQTDQSSLIALVKKAGVKTDAKTLALGMNSKNDKALDAAEQVSKLDETLLDMIHTILGSYQKDLQLAYQGNFGNNTKASLTTAFENSKLLLPATDEPKK